MQTSHISKPRVAAFGEWNTTNLGDRAIFEGVTAFFREAGWHVDGYGLGTLTPVQSSSSLLNVEKRHDEQESVNSHSTSSSNPGLSAISQGSLKRSLRGLRQRIRIRQLIPQLNQAQAILVGGGALLSDWNLHFPQSLIEVTWVAKQLNLPIICLGCSAEGEWSNVGRRIISDFAQTCRFIATRDQGTADRISELIASPVEVFGDFALALNCDRSSLGRNIDNPTPKTVAVNVMELPHLWQAHQQHYEDLIVEIVNTLASQESMTLTTSIKLFTTGNPEDSTPAKRVFARLTTQHKSLTIPTNVEELRSIFRGSQAVIASRLHAAILAISEETPVIGFTPGSKIHRFFESLGIGKFSLESLDKQAVFNVLTLLADPAFNQQVNMLDVSKPELTRTKVHSLLHQLVEQPLIISAKCR